jgi:hypothetical protein
LALAFLSPPSDLAQASTTQVFSMSLDFLDGYLATCLQGPDENHDTKTQKKQQDI